MKQSQLSPSSSAFRPTPIRKSAMNLPRSCWNVTTSPPAPPGLGWRASPQTVRFAETEGTGSNPAPHHPMMTSSSSIDDESYDPGSLGGGLDSSYASAFRSTTPLTVSTTGTMSPSLHKMATRTSSFGFIPIPKEEPYSQHHHHHHHHPQTPHAHPQSQRFKTPPPPPPPPPSSSSTFDLRKVVASPSPVSMMSALSADDNSSITSRTNSPSCFTPIAYRNHHHHHPRSCESPYGFSSSSSSSHLSARPRTIPSSANKGGRKSPFASLSATSSTSITSTPTPDDDLVRKTRIKTEMCMHYENGRPCPFGADCTYAHGEEELQMTKLLDLEQAGLIDVETYRTKPCFTWVMTGSW